MGSLSEPKLTFPLMFCSYSRNSIENCIHQKILINMSANRRAPWDLVSVRHFVECFYSPANVTTSAIHANKQRCLINLGCICLPSWRAKAWAHEVSNKQKVYSSGYRPMVLTESCGCEDCETLIIMLHGDTSWLCICGSRKFVDSRLGLHVHLSLFRMS